MLLWNRTPWLPAKKSYSFITRVYRQKKKKKNSCVPLELYSWTVVSLVQWSRWLRLSIVHPKEPSPEYATKPSKFCSFYVSRLYVQWNIKRSVVRLSTKKGASRGNWLSFIMFTQPEKNAHQGWVVTTILPVLFAQCSVKSESSPEANLRLGNIQI